MADDLVKCEACNMDISKQAEKCPHCGHPNKKFKKPAGCLQVIGGIFVVLIAIGFFAGGGMDKQVAKEMQKVNNTVADDMVAQYNIAKGQGDKVQICVQAGMVSAAYLQAKDEANYKQWKSTQNQDCKRAGLPSM